MSCDVDVFAEQSQLLFLPRVCVWHGIFYFECHSVLVEDSVSVEPIHRACLP